MKDLSTKELATMNPADLYYSHDPIVEAILGISIDPSAVTIADLERLKGQFGDEYIEQFQVDDFAGEIKLGPTVGLTGSRSPAGFAFRNSSRNETVSARLGNFSYHRLHPYPGWQAFRNKAKGLWEIFHSQVGGPPLKQLELRYINRLEVPAGEELSTYLQTFPEIGKSLPQAIAGYQIVASLLLDRLPGQVRLIQAMVESNVPGHMSIILDNTLVFQPGNANDSPWEWFDQARLEKNRIFQGCITTQMENRIR